MLKILGIQTKQARSLQNGGFDANGQKPQTEIAQGGSNPCRHCLGLIEEGNNILILSFRPFPTKQPYAETGPVFLHAEQCERYENSNLPDWFEFLDPAIVRGYDDKDWIMYETGEVVAGKNIENKCTEILSDPQVSYVHVRSRFNCFQCRVERA